MFGIVTYIYHKNQLNVSKYTIHGWYGIAFNGGKGIPGVVLKVPIPSGISGEDRDLGGFFGLSPARNVGTVIFRWGGSHSEAAGFYFTKRLTMT